MMTWLGEQWSALGRYQLLRGFWSTRTVFYRDTAKAIKSNEALPSYLEGEMQIARDPKTANPDRAKGFAYASDIQNSSDLNLADLLRALMPKSDALALSALQKAKDIPKALTDLAKNIEQQQAMASTIRKALISPAFVIAIAFAFAYIFATQVIPAFEKAATDDVWLSTYNNMVRHFAYELDLGIFVGSDKPHSRLALRHGKQPWLAQSFMDSGVPFAANFCDLSRCSRHEHVG